MNFPEFIPGNGCRGRLFSGGVRGNDYSGNVRRNLDDFSDLVGNEFWTILGRNKFKPGIEFCRGQFFHKQRYAPKWYTSQEEGRFFWWVSHENSTRKVPPFGAYHLGALHSFASGGRRNINFPEIEAVSRGFPTGRLDQLIAAVEELFRNHQKHPRGEHLLCKQLSDQLDVALGSPHGYTAPTFMELNSSPWRLETH